MDLSKFLCNLCAHQTPDDLIVGIATSLDSDESGSDVEAAYSINEAADLLSGG